MASTAIPFTYDYWHGVWAQGQAPDNSIYSAVLFAQYVHETGNGSSNLFKEHNNLFGMAPAQSREKFYQGTTMVAEGVKASYDDALFSLQDRIDLDAFNKINAPISVDEISVYMAEVMNAGYATDPNYVKAWVGNLNSLFPTLAVETPPSSGFFGVFGAMKWVAYAFIAFLAYKAFKAVKK